MVRHTLKILQQMLDINLGYFVISKAKLDDCFRNAQFNLRNFGTRAKREIRAIRSKKDKNGGGLNEFLKKGFLFPKIKVISAKI